METHNKFKLHKLRFAWKRLAFQFLHLTVSEPLYSSEGGGEYKFIAISDADFPVVSITRFALKIFLNY